MVSTEWKCIKNMLGKQRMQNEMLFAMAHCNVMRRLLLLLSRYVLHSCMIMRKHVIQK